MRDNVKFKKAKPVKRGKGRPSIYGRNSTIHFRVPLKVREHLEQLALKERRTLSDIVNIALDTFVQAKG